MNENPLLSKFKTPYGVPPFDKIKTAHFTPAFEFAMQQQRTAIDEITADKSEVNFENTIEQYINSYKLIYSVELIFSAYSNANTNEEIEAIEQEMSPVLAAFSDEILMNKKLFAKIKTVYDKQEELQLTEEQTYILENIYKGFVRQGALLPPEKQEVLKEINIKLSELTVKFSQNVLSETNAYELVIDNKADLSGLPDNVVEAAAETAKKAGKDGKWVFTHQVPSYIPFMKYADNRTLREQFYRARSNRCNNNNELDNKAIVEQIFTLKATRAELLGYEHHGAYRLEDRMAKHPDKASALLNEIWDKAFVVAKKELQELQKLAKSLGADFEIQKWDWSYYSEKLRKQKYDLDDNELRPYFQLENVIEGVFTLSEKLYGITFHKVDVPHIHKNEIAYEVKEADGKHIGLLFLDLFPRKSKREGGWCSEYRGRYLENGQIMSPLVTITCNFTKPLNDKPALLSMNEVETFFHEFGHALDGLFSTQTYLFEYRAWDFVELPSQIMEHWATESEMLKIYAKHHETNEVIPAELIEKMEKSKHFNQGYFNIRQLQFGLIDLACHTIKAGEALDIVKFEKAFFDKIDFLPKIEENVTATFGHIIRGYDSGYYSYMWAAVLDNDAYEAFEKNGIFDQDTAKRFRQEILEKNGIADPMKIYLNFKGEAPKIDALLRNKGLIK